MRSTDGGVSWGAVAAAEANPWMSVAYGNGVWIAVSPGGANRLMRSIDDGVTWTSVGVADGVEANQWTSVAYGNDVWVAVSRSGANRAMHSTDNGLTWTSVVVEFNTWLSVGYADGVWVAVSDAGVNKVMRSVNAGVSWTPVGVADGVEASSWKSVAYGNGVWVAVAQGGVANQQIMRSTDGGVSWGTVAAAGFPVLSSVAYGNGVWVAVLAGGAKQVMRSVDATASASTDPGVPGIFLTVEGPVGRSASESPIYYGADRVAVTSTYLLTVTGVSNIAPTITTLAEGTIDADGSFSSMTRLPALTPGVYNVQMVGTHVNGSTLQLTSQVTIGGVGEFTSIGANIPVIQ